MKVITIILSLLCLSLCSFAQQTRGWEFLYWNMPKDSAEKVLKEKNNLLSEAWALDADFNYQDMNTWLIYDTQNRLKQVHQRKTFSVINQKEAAAFYKKEKEDLISKYGKPGKINENKQDSVITLSWKLAYTKIAFEYDYKYKIIDEFGAGSYWIDIIFEAVKAQ